MSGIDYKSIKKEERDDYEKCYCCGKWFKKDEMEKGLDENSYCDECYNETFGECERCGEVFYWADMREAPDGEFFCEDCWNECCTTCDNCGETIRRDEAFIYYDSNYCEDCYNENFVMCEDCGATIPTREAYYDDDDNAFCANCFNANRIIRRWNYVPDYNFHKLSYENTTFMGYELEVEYKGGYSLNRAAEEVRDFLKKKGLEDYFYFKEDGSLCTGFEIVSHPATLQAMRQDMKLYELVHFLRKHNFTSHDNGNCGFHIHASWKDMCRSDIEKILLFFVQNPCEIATLYQRSGSSYAQEWTLEGVRDFTRGNTIGHRHMMVNLLPEDNVEFRGAKGSLYYPRLIATLQFTDCLIQYIHSSGRNHFRCYCWADFISFAKQRGYGAFITYMKTRDKEEEN